MNVSYFSYEWVMSHISHMNESCLMISSQLWYIYKNTYLCIHIQKYTKICIYVYNESCLMISSQLWYIYKNTYLCKKKNTYLCIQSCLMISSQLCSLQPLWTQPLWWFKTTAQTFENSDIQTNSENSDIQTNSENSDIQTNSESSDIQTNSENSKTKNMSRTISLNLSECLNSQKSAKDYMTIILWPRLYRSQRLCRGLFWEFLNSQNLNSQKTLGNVVRLDCSRKFSKF